MSATRSAAPSIGYFAIDEKFQHQLHGQPLPNGILYWGVSQMEEIT